MREKKQTGEQCWGRLARLMSAFRQIMKRMRNRSRERKCLFDAFDVRKMSAMLSKRWMSDTCEILLEDWEACVAQKGEGRRRAERMERHKACVVKITCGGSRRGSGNKQCNLWCAACGGQYNWKKPNRVLVTLNIAGPSEAAVFRATLRRRVRARIWYALSNISRNRRRRQLGGHDLRYFAGAEQIENHECATEAIEVVGPGLE